MTYVSMAKPQTKPISLAKKGKKRPPLSLPQRVNAGIGLGNGFRLQPKLKIGEPNDQYEQEADRVADQMMRMPESQVKGQFEATELIEGIQRIDMQEEEEMMQTKPISETIQRMCTECEEEKLQTKSENGGISTVAPSIQSGINRLRQGGGVNLPESTQGFMESRFSHDFSNVKIHTSPQAADLSQKVNARAFTVGQDIFFNRGEFQPNTPSGGWLLAHEMVHTIQQEPVSSFNTDPVNASPPQPMIMPYRSKDSANFGACDTSTLKEESFSMARDKKTKPWIEKITIKFDGVTNDTDGDLVPTGHLTATYFNNPKKFSDITSPIVGGKAPEGLTNQGSHSVERIEGCGYHHTSVPKAEQIKGHKRASKYFKDPSQATMSFAVFFLEGRKTGNQAIHRGLLSTGSLACVHIDNQDVIRQINYHSVQFHTKVEVSYASSSLQKLCCKRFEVKGYMVSNPCKRQDPEKC